MIEIESRLSPKFRHSNASVLVKEVVGGKFDEGLFSTLSLSRFGSRLLLNTVQASELCDPVSR